MCKLENNIEEQRKWNDLSLWSDEGHEWSEHFGGTENLWFEFLLPRLEPFLKDNINILEIAPGQGRITNYLIDYTDDLIIVDMNDKLIDICKEKFKNFDNIKYYVNDGISLEFLEDNSIDFVISWDSFVHMHQEVIEKYIEQISKKLKIGGCGFIHHSNLKGGKDLSFDNICGRANNNALWFADKCKEYGMTIIKQEYVKWTKVHDIISTFKKSTGEIKVEIASIEKGKFNV